ncbi:hypothetical protein E2562_036029 [Oryza meyeriana var. granulata]|uniref:Bifunctional inhibitor/plant lipid transfer protein/seed storage helical domain-containing protein n=1 Tax=Oryza meyeriana var. granulata TaxID=110450 RepID=A0A6G1CX67_9ORYZ|nr:hypothetical protein E2562_036029 [Oryza meyeriana var. granulata]
MAPSSKLTALFFAFAVVAATLAPAAEARVQGFNQEAAPEPGIAGEKAATGGAQQPPTLLGLPGLPFPLFPFPLPIGSPGGGAPPSSGSGFPFWLPFQQPGSSGGAPPSSGSPAAPPSPPQPKECMTPLMSMMPCAEYLTNTTVTTPPATCCDGFKSIVNTAPICLCHGMNGDLNKFLPLPVDLMKMMMLPATCGAMVPLQTLSMCNSPAVPPLMPPSPPAASAPAPASPPSP